MTLPPRTPSWMPLDYAVWDKVMDKVTEESPTDDKTEAKEEYLARLEKVARTLPKAWVKRVFGRMKENIQAVKDAKGWIPKNDRADAPVLR